MQKFIVKGGNPLKGTVKISGSKNASLPIITACLLTKEKCTLKNVPDIADIHTMCKILNSLNVETNFEKNTLEIDAKNATLKDIKTNLVNKMRASILLLGPLLARFNKAKLPFPGGCVLGKRSVDTHLDALEGLNCKVSEKDNVLTVQSDGLKGNKIIMTEISVTATENAVMAAVLAKGKTEIRLAACEPHVQDLCNFLNKMGAKIKGIGTNNLEIEGVSKLKGITYTVTPDYLEAGTFAIAAAITKGDVTIENVRTDQLDSFWNALAEVGVNFKFEKEDKVVIKPAKKFNKIKQLRTAVYPSFPTDLQAPFTVLLTQASGISKIFETLFEGRLNYLFELEKMGAKVEILNPHEAIIVGPSKLKGTPIASCDIGAGAAMVVAALAADGETEISNINYTDRGYERLDEKLRNLGAEIQRV